MQKDSDETVLEWGEGSLTLASDFKANACFQERDWILLCHCCVDTVPAGLAQW